MGSAVALKIWEVADSNMEVAQPAVETQSN